MRALFCEKTLDISLFLSEKEIRELRRSQESNPVLSAKHHDLEFYLMNSNKLDYIKVDEPRTLECSTYWIVINDSAYDTLVREGKCGTRYGASSKVSVMREMD
jgi:hypothetical protein